LRPDKRTKSTACPPPYRRLANARLRFARSAIFDFLFRCPLAHYCSGGYHRRHKRGYADSWTLLITVSLEELGNDCTMTRQAFSLMTFLSAVRHCRLVAILCALLTLWAGFDSQVLLLASSGSVCPASQTPSPGQEDSDDDDCFLDLTGTPAPCRSMWRNARPPSPMLDRQIAVTKHFSPLQRPMPTTPICEHDFRNGIGAPLLC
jgi:hypothetical protein